MNKSIKWALASTVALGFLSPAYAQTSLHSSNNDKATSWSFSDKKAAQDFQGKNPEAKVAALSDEPDIDAVLASEASSRFRVQLSVSNDYAAMEELQSRLPKRYPEMFADHSLIIEDIAGDASRYRALVTGFDGHSAAKDWCSLYRQETRKDCLAVDAEAKSGDRQSSRLTEVAQKISENMNGVAASAVAVASDGTEQPFIRTAQGMKFHQFQRAWEKADASAGVYVTRYCATCSYKMNLRELMISTFEVPKGETITGFDIGDPTLFEAKKRGTNSLAIMAKAFGTDTNLNIYTDSGRTYPVYLRALDVRSHLVPDILFRVTDPTITYTEVVKPETLRQAAALIDAPAKVNTLDLLNTLKPQGMNDADFLKEIPFDPAKVTFKGFKISGSRDMKLKPDIVFRDDAFIFIYFANPNKVPAFESYSVYDGYDELVGTTVHGRLYAIKALVPLVSLKSGNSYLCIEIDLKAA